MSKKHPILDFIDQRGGLRKISHQELSNCYAKLMEDHSMNWPSLEQRAARAEAMAMINGEFLRRLAEDRPDVR